MRTGEDRRTLRRSPDHVPAFDELVANCATVLDRAGPLAASTRPLLERALDLVESEQATATVRAALVALAGER